MQVSIADSLTKLLREPENGASLLRRGTARISACRNERESLQVVVEAGTEALHNVTVSVSDLRDEAGDHVIPATRIRINPVGYVETKQPAYPVERTGWWPDPLLPPEPMDVLPGRRQPFWLTVHVPEAATAGRYQGTITVSAGDGADQQVPLVLRVWDFALAPNPPLPSAIAIYTDTLSQFYNQDPLPESTLRNYWDMLFSHRLSSDDLGTYLRQGMEAVIDGRDTGPFDYHQFDECLEYCFPRGLTAFQGARLPGFLERGPDLNEAERARIVSCLRDLAEHLEARGWLDRAFAMVWDEPRDQYAQQVLKELQTVHRSHPRLRTRLDGPVTGPLVDLCQEEVDIWGLHMLNIAQGGNRARANIERWRQQKKLLWVYVACDVHHPYPNIFIDYPLIDCRMLPWLCWKYDLEGLLYWSANYWGEANLMGAGPEAKWPNRPWVAANFVSHWEGQAEYFNGDGHLIYPGPNGTALSSLRLEALRDGMEDYEYVRLLANGVEQLEAAGKSPDLVAQAKRWLSEQRVVESFADWCHDPEELLSAREQMAEVIEHMPAASGL